MEFLIQITLVLLLVFLNGFFVAAEFALVSLRITRVDELIKKGNKVAPLLKKALGDLDSIISATQLGITVASLALGWIGEPAIARFINPFFSFLPETFAFFSAHTIATVIAFSIITFLHLVLGELAPKTVALQRSEVVSLLVIAPLTLFTKIFWPIIVVLNGAGSLVLKLFGLSAPSGHQLVHSEEEIKMLLDQSSLGGVIPRQEVEMVRNVFRMGDVSVKNIMVPRTDIIAFPTSSTFSECIAKIQRTLHSRYPIYEGSIDNIIGFVHVKDVYREIIKNKTDKRLIDANIVREIIHLPERKKASEALLDLRRGRIHIAVVNDEYGGTAGILTLEDIIEGLVGEIQDEFDAPQKDIIRESDGSFIIRGQTPVGKVQRKAKIAIKGLGYTTIGGFVFGLLGREPRVGDKVEIGTVSFEVLKLIGERIVLLRLRKLPSK
ncbi:HlyC/CorC family transporter [Candidatus Gottesmanbacteria bacterium]|nr:HlyC/CorC family transporter [Candidatus Gottesmanbacteria bacterium]